MLRVDTSVELDALCRSKEKLPYDHLRADWFTTVAHARALAKRTALPNLRSLEVRCTVPEPDARKTSRTMMQIIAGSPLEHLRIVMPVFEYDIGGIHAKAAVQRLELVDRSQFLKTTYLFERDDKGALSRLAVTVAVPTTKTKVLGCSVSKDFINGIFEGLENCLASLPARAITTLSIRTKPALSKREHKQRLAAIAKRFKATVA